MNKISAEINKCIEDYVNDINNSLKIKTLYIHTYKEDGLQVINEINYYLDNSNLGKILYFQLIDNQ